MHTDSSLPPANTNQPANDHLLEELAALTGLFSPEVLWHTEEKLDDLTTQQRLAQKNESRQQASDLEEPTTL
ncbi:MAG: hypothetical protein EOO63_03090 [Hymenobacter sp.]|nr:MAG: hypothetical protein EOO63_03090 [Hymenobacter sp.]